MTVQNMLKKIREKDAKSEKKLYKKNSPIRATFTHQNDNIATTNKKNVKKLNCEDIIELFK